MSVHTFYDLRAIKRSGLNNVQRISSIPLYDDLCFSLGFHNFHRINDYCQLFIIDNLEHEALDELASNPLFSLIAFLDDFGDESLPSVPSSKCLCRDGGSWLSLSRFLRLWKRMSCIILAWVLWYQLGLQSRYWKKYLAFSSSLVM